MTTESTPVRYLFLDLETTGLDPQADKILEVAAIVTDERFVELSHYSAVIALGKAPITVDPYVLAMHGRNGLWAACSGTEQQTTTLAEFDTDYARSMEAHGRVTWRLVGNSVHFDREFLRHQMPRVFAKLHHRQLDLTSLNLMAESWDPAVLANRPKVDDNHRAMSDARTSLELARYYAGRGAAPAVAAPAPADTKRPTGKPLTRKDLSAGDIFWYEDGRLKFAVLPHDRYDGWLPTGVSFSTDITSADRRDVSVRLVGKVDFATQTVTWF